MIFRLLAEPIKRVVLEAFLTAIATALGTVIVEKTADRLFPEPKEPEKCEPKSSS